LLEKGMDPYFGQMGPVKTHPFDLRYIVNPYAVYPFHYKGLFCYIFGVNFRYMYIGVLFKISFEPGTVPRLLNKVHLFSDSPGKFVHYTERIKKPAFSDILVKKPGNRKKNVNIRFDPFPDFRTLHFHNNIGAVKQRGP